LSSYIYDLFNGVLNISDQAYTTTNDRPAVNNELGRA